jgi:very-short-patch-repair endonuclease
VDRRAKSGRLKRLHRGVYLMGPIAPPRAREMAAVLACGEGAALSHRSAAACWQLLPPCEDRVHVLVSGSRPARRAGMQIHRASLVREDDITAHHSIPLTTPARTLYDLAGTASARELERAVAEAFALRLTNKSAVGELVRRHSRRPGAKRLQILLERGSRPALTRSEAEERFLTLIRKTQLRDPEVNIRVEGYEVDFLWRDERLVVEIDGRAFHSSDRTFESDRRRDAVLIGAGLRVMRVTWRQIVEEPEALLVRLALALSAGPGRAVTVGL